MVNGFRLLFIKTPISLDTHKQFLPAPPAARDDRSNVSFWLMLLSW